MACMKWSQSEKSILLVVFGTASFLLLTPLLALLIFAIPYFVGKFGFKLLVMIWDKLMDWEDNNE